MTIDEAVERVKDVITYIIVPKDAEALRLVLADREAFREKVEFAESLNVRLAEDLDACQKALRPFAEMARTLDSHKAFRLTDDCPIEPASYRNPLESEPTVGDCRLALAALEGK